MPPPVTPVRFHVCLGKMFSCRNTYSGLLSYPSIRPRQTLSPTISLFEGLAANHSQARTQSSMNDKDLLSSCVPCILPTSTRIQRVPLALPFPFALRLLLRRSYRGEEMPWLSPLCPCSPSLDTRKSSRLTRGYWVGDLSSQAHLT